MTTNGVVRAAPAVAGGKVYVGAGTACSTPWTLAPGPPSWTAATGTVRWTDGTVTHTTSGTTAVTVANGAIYASRHFGVTAHHP